uniref:Uncharacterized protein n=1 Tax=Oryza sativa subsp. japonica TaxID=39947 RepID=Q69R93_ORYSJ|nr:hypothetical protein [Oryza sativa Japonica Group]BAD31202.1 hypothetical protein [Oryza sativa Japonica Group]
MNGGGGSGRWWRVGSGGRWLRGTGGRASPHLGTPIGGGGKRRRRRRRRRGATGVGRRRWRARRRWRRSYGAREGLGDGENERGGLGDPIYSLGLKRSDSSRKKSIREIKNSVLEINSRTSLIRIKYSTISSNFWG